MLNIKFIEKNKKIKINYKLNGIVKSKIINFDPLKIKKNSNGSFVNIIDNESYSINPEGSNYAYNCLYNKKFKSINYYLNTVLQLKELMGKNFIKDLEAPKLVFYDIETNEYAIPKKDNKNKVYVDKRAKINSIAWIDELGNEYILVRGVNGSEKEILQQFIEYIKDNDVMGIVGHNSFKFDNIVCKERIKALKIDYNYSDNVFYNQCNMDTMLLASFLQFTPNKSISLNNLSELLIDDFKTDLEGSNPIKLYNEAIEEYKNSVNDKLDLFKKYNLQDVRLTKACFEAMNSMNSCIDIFKQTLCRFDKLHSNQELLNSYTCNVCYNDYKKVIPEFTDTKIRFKNEGGYNYYNTKQNKELQVYDNVVCFDIVSYYPNLLRLIKADTTNPYKNINRNTGEITEFEELSDGLLGNISENLFKSRISIKQKMNDYEKGSEEYNILNREQKAKKIIVNSLYGVLKTKKTEFNYFILKNQLIGALITKIGREILKEIRKEFNGIYAKTDSVFIELKNKTKKDLLKDLNNYLNIFIKSTYNLNNIKNGEQLIRFEIDKKIDKLIIKDKNNYCWFENGKQHYKGSSFHNTNNSQFEKDNIQKIMDLKFENKSDDIIKDIIVSYASEVIEKHNHNIKYFSQKQKITKNTVNKKLIIAKKFLKDQGYNFEYNNRYNYCCIENRKYSYILYDNYHNFDDNSVIKKEYCLKLAIDTLKNLKIIDTETKNDLYKEYKIDKFNNSINSLINSKDQTTLTSGFKIIPFDKTKSKKLLKLNELIPDTSDYYNKGYLKFIKGFKTKKGFKVPKGFKYNLKNIDKELSIDKISDNDNIGVITGYKGLSCLDIDGAKGILTDKQNQDLKKYLLKILQATGYPFIIQESVSKGFHLFYYDNENIEFDFSHIHYPENFEIAKLRGESLGESTIEVFNKPFKPIMLTPSSFNSEEKYNLLEDNYKWGQIFNKETTDIYTLIEEQFKKHGFKVSERKQHKQKQYNNNYKNKKPKELNDTEITKVSEACNTLMELAHKNHNKHHLTMALAGVFSNYYPISEDSLLKIKDNIVSETGKLMDNINLFENTLINCYLENREDKKGFNSIKKSLANDSNKTNECITIIKKYCENIDETNITKDSSEVTKQKESIYKPPSNLNPNKYKYTSEALYCKLYMDQEYYFRISRNESNYSYSIIQSYSEEITEANMGYLTIEFSTKKSITEEDPNRNRKLGQYCKGKLEFIKPLKNISLELKNTEGFEQITKPFKVFEEKTIERGDLSLMGEKIKISATSLLINKLQTDNFVKNSITNELYKYDITKNCYIYYNLTYYKKYIQEINEQLNEAKNITNQIAINALHSLFIYKDVYHNIICFKNGYYNTNTNEFIEEPFKEGIPYYQLDINYNPSANIGEHFNKFWNNYDSDLQTQILEFINYLLQKGNPHKKFFIIVGLPDSGKTTLTNIIKDIIKKCSDVPLKHILKEGHELTPLLNSNVNFMSDEEHIIIDNNSILKKLSGNDDLFINPKFKDPVTLKGDDVPKQVIVCNNIPKINNVENAIKNRLGIIILNTKEIIKKDKQDKKIEDKIKSENNSYEWLIYNALQTKIDKPSWDMSYKSDKKFNDIVGKYSTPIKYILKKGFEYIGQHTNFKNETCSNYENYITNTEMNKFLNKASELEKVQIPQLNTEGEVKPKVITGYINDIFALRNYERKVKYVNGKTQRVYYCLSKTQYYYNIINS